MQQLDEDVPKLLELIVGGLLAVGDRPDARDADPAVHLQLGHHAPQVRAHLVVQAQAGHLRVSGRYSVVVGRIAAGRNEPVLAWRVFTCFVVLAHLITMPISTLGVQDGVTVWPTRPTAVKRALLRWQPWLKPPLP